MCNQITSVDFLLPLTTVFFLLTLPTYYYYSFAANSMLTGRYDLQTPNRILKLIHCVVGAFAAFKTYKNDTAV